MRAAALALALLLAVPAGATPPCGDAVAVGDRVSVTVGCVRWCATAATVTVPQLRAELAHCRATATADRDQAAALADACERHVADQRRLLDAAPVARQWYQVPWLWGVVGAVAGGTAVWAVTR